MSFKLELSQQVTSHILSEANKVTFDNCLPAMVQTILDTEA